MATYILIHGAWHAKWAWEIVYSIFPKEHTVVALDLPGHGANKQKFQEINLKTYVDYVIDCIADFSEKVILVGHSMAGMIISQVAEIFPEQIERLSYVTAFVPANGENALAIAQKWSQAGISTEMIWRKSKTRIDLKQSAFLQKILLNGCSEICASKALKLLSAEPMQPFLD